MTGALCLVAAAGRGWPSPRAFAMAAEWAGTREDRPSAVPSPDPSSTSYEAFMKLEPADRRQAFARLSAADKAGLMKTHMRRWLGAHRRELTPRQRKVIEASIATLAPEFYEQPTSKEWRDKAIEQFRHAAEVFSEKQLAEIFTLEGAYVPERE